MSDPSSQDEGRDPDPRGFANLAAIAAVVALVILGYWAFSTLDRQRKLQNCLDSGRHDCAELPGPAR